MPSQFRDGVTDRITIYVDTRNLSNKGYTPEFCAVINACHPSATTHVFYPSEGRTLFVSVLDACSQRSIR